MTWVVILLILLLSETPTKENPILIFILFLLVIVLTTLLSPLGEKLIEYVFPQERYPKGRPLLIIFVFVAIAAALLSTVLTQLEAGPVISSIATPTSTDNALDATRVTNLPSPDDETIQLTFGNGDNVQPAFSFDGSQIVFISTRDGNNEIYKMDSDGSNQTRLSNTPNSTEDYPSFSPDGNKIIYTRNEGTDREIYIMDIDGGNEINISNTPGSSEGRPKFFRGNFITLNVIFDSDITGNWEIYWSNFNNNKLVNITQLTNRPAYNNRLASHIPIDMGKVLFRSESITDYEDSSIYVIDFDGTNPIRLSNSNDWYPTITSDRNWIVFVSDRDGNPDIYKMRLDGSELENVTNDASRDDTPSVSPDSKYLVYSSSSSGGNYHLFIRNFDHSTPIQEPTNIFMEPTTQVSTEILPVDVVARLSFDDVFDSKLFFDKSRYRNHGSCEGDSCPSGGHPGMAGTSFYFDGFDDFVNLGNPESMNFIGEITIEAWINSESVDGIRDIVAHGFSGSTQKEVFLRIFNNRYEVGSWEGKSNKAYLEIPVGDINTWVYLVGTYDQKEWRLFRNGNEVAHQASQSGSILIEENWSIGARGTGSERFFEGFIDEVVIHNRALRLEEILERYKTISNTLDR